MKPPAGLSHEEVLLRRAEHGPNRLPEPPPPKRLALAVGQLRNGMVALLAGAAVLSVVLGQMSEAALILAIVVANSVLGYLQEARADAATRALRSLLVTRAHVIRDGRKLEVDAQELVPGDLLVLAAGERIAADARLVQTSAVEVDESTLTGESLPVPKDATATAAPDAPLGDRPDSVFAGTTMVRGSARAVITATGARTQLGAVAAAVPEEAPRTPLQVRLDGLAVVLLRASVVTGLLLGLLSWVYGESPEEALLVAVALAVAVVPEGLPAVVTVTLAIGMARMADRGAVVRRLHAVETLGSTTVICSDKTGTLTENRMSLTEAWPCEGDREALLAAALLASDAEPSSPEEQAIAKAAGTPRARLLDGARVVRVDPFDASTRRMTVVVERPGGEIVRYVKGAPESLLPELPAQERESVAEVVDAWARDGKRLLLVAEGRDGDGLRPRGLLALSDPPRATAAASIASARRAGVRTVMITGDHPATALAIARGLGIVTDGRDRVLSGARLDALSDEELERRVHDVEVFARVEPAHKLRVVRALQARGEVVAMTGDGVNDVPALAAAHIGVAMGKRGTDAAIDAADMVLTDDDYSTIVRAIEHGRAIHDNVARFVHFLLATNAGAALLFALAIPLGLGAPLTVPQILVVNLLTDGLPAVALGLDPPGRDVMSRPPRPLREGLLAPLRGRLVLAGLGTAAACFAALLIGRRTDAATGQTMAFATLVLAKLLYVFSTRGAGWPWRAGLNRGLLAAVALSAAAVVPMLALPGLRDALGATVLDAGQLGWIAALSLLPLVIVETHKLRVRRADNH